MAIGRACLQPASLCLAALLGTRLLWAPRHEGLEALALHSALGNLRKTPGTLTGSGTCWRKRAAYSCLRQAEECPEHVDTTAQAAAGGSIVCTAASVAKGMVGSGVLSLSAGVAAFTHTPQGLSLAVAMIVTLTVISGYTFQMVAEVSAETGKADFGDVWSASVGQQTAWMPRVAVFCISGIACVIYAMLLGDLLADILRGALLAGGAASWKSALVPWCSRAPALTLLTAGVLLPLCLAENFANLAFTSVLGLAACFYLASFTVWRLFDGSYTIGDKFFSACSIQPAPLVEATKLADTLNLKTLVFLSNVGMAYMNHGMAPGTYQELAPNSPDAPRTPKLRRYAVVCTLAFALAGGLCTVIMAAGFLTFGAATNGNLLTGYATTDAGATFARFCVMLSVLFGFPLNFVLMRSEVASTLSRSFGPLGRRGIQKLTAALLAVNTVLALMLKDLGIVQAAAGATLGSFIVYIAPALMSRAAHRRRGGFGRGRAVVEILLITFGVLLASLGLAVTLGPK